MTSRSTRLRLIGAFAAVYLIWGSTYLAIRFTIETIPPFVAASVRFLIAGFLVYWWQRARGAERPTAQHWRTAVIVGGLLLMGGNGLVFYAERTVPSGLAALLVAIVPLWIALLTWTIGRDTPSAQGVVGLLMGFAGVALLVGPGSFGGGAAVDRVGAVVLGIASLSWAAGSLYSREAPQPRPQLLGSGMAMIAGGVLLLVTATVTGEFARLDLAGVSYRSGLALTYLIVFGSIVGFTAYLWLMKATTPARAATYAYVNPVVAVILGSLLADEVINLRIVLAAAIIVSAVALIISARGRRPRLQTAPQPVTGTPKKSIRPLAAP